MKELSQFLLALNLVTSVTPGHQRPSTPHPQYCELTSHSRNVRCNLDHQRLTCRGGFTRKWINGIHSDIVHLRIVDWPGQCMPVGHFQLLFPGLQHLELVNCTLVTTFQGRFTAASRIEKLSMHGMASLWQVPPELVGHLMHLREMDLRGNMLRHMKPDLFVGPPNLESVYLSDNHWDCSDGGLDWLAMEAENGTARSLIKDYSHLVCHQQLYRGKPLHIVMDIIRTMHTTCPEPCVCAMTHVVSNAQGAVIPLITVNCAGKMLHDPPADLPPGTTTLRLDGNEIKTIHNIVHNPDYKKLADLYLDNNSISAVKELEGTEWFATFRVLSLRGNLMKQIPVYAFDKAFQGNNNIMHVFLGNNPWRCDCHFIPRFQSLLRKYRRVVRDLQDIRCAASGDKKTSLVPIISMPLGNVCGSGTELPISPINIVNIVLFTLIMLVLGRFLYDWRNFKRTGKLPWLSSVMP